VKLRTIPLTPERFADFESVFRSKGCSVAQQYARLERSPVMSRTRASRWSRGASPRGP